MNFLELLDPKKEKNPLGSLQNFFCYTINLAAVSSRKSSDTASVQLKNKKKKILQVVLYVVCQTLAVNKHGFMKLQLK